MAPMRRFGLPDFLSLVLVLAAAAGLRAGYVYACCDKATTSGPLRVQDAPRTPPGSREGDPDELELLIRNVSEHRTFATRAPFAGKEEGSSEEIEERTAHVAPGFPWLAGQLARAFPDRYAGLIRWIHVGLGALTAALYFLFARRAFRSLAVGLLAGLFTAANPFSIVSTGTLDDGVLASFALAGCLFLCGQAGEEGGPLSSLLLGLSLGGLGLVRASFLPFAFVGLVWFLVRSRALPSSWLCGLLSFLGFLTALAPWGVRNYKVIGEPVPVVSSTYLHLWIGNNPEATGGPMTPAMQPEVSAESLRDAKNQQVRYSMLGKEVASEIRHNPGATLQRRLRAAFAFLVGERWLTAGELAEPTRAATAKEEAEDEKPSFASRLTRWCEGAQPVVLHAALLVMLGLGLLGWRWSFVWRWESIPAMLAAFWVPLPYVLGHAEGLSGPRLPLDGVLLCFAAFAAAALMPGINAGLFDRKEAPAAPPAPTF